MSRTAVSRPARWLAVVATLAAAGIVGSQGRGNPTDWPTAHGDAQRTSWIRADANISPETMSTPGFELQWTTTLESPVRHGVSLGAGVVTSGVNIFTPLSTIAAPSNQIFALDNDTGNLFWARRFEGALPAGTAACPGGISGTLTRLVDLTTPLPGAGRGGGRGRGSYSSAVGEPGAGVPLPGRGGGAGRGTTAPQATATAPPATAPAAPTPAPPAGGRASASAPAPTVPPGQWRPSPFPTNPVAQGSWTGLFRPSGVVYAVSGDGLFRTLGLVSGKDLQRPAPFVPAGARFSDLIAVNDRVYAATSGGCGGAADGIWSIDIASEQKSVVSWKTNGGSPIGSVAFASDGTAIVAIGPGKVTAGGHANAIVALDPKTLTVKDWFTKAGVEFVAPPVLFHEDGKDIVAVVTRDVRIMLLDAASLGGVNHDTPLFASESLNGGAAAASAHAPALWQERRPIAGTTPAANAPAALPSPATSEGPRWLLVPLAGRIPANLAAAANGEVRDGAILGAKIEYRDGRFSAQPAWLSQNIAAPLTPIVVNGVAFAASGPSNVPAALYALHGATGKPLWDSGKTIASPLSGRSFWAGSGHVFVGTRDGTVYAFGFAMERK